MPGAKPKILTVAGGPAKIAQAIGLSGPLKQPLTAYHTALNLKFVPKTHGFLRGIPHIAENLKMVPGSHQIPIVVEHTAENWKLVPGSHEIPMVVAHSAENMKLVPGVHSADIVSPGGEVYDAGTPGAGVSIGGSTVRPVYTSVLFSPAPGSNEARVLVRGSSSPSGTQGLQICIGPAVATGPGFKSSPSGWPVRMQFSGSNTITLSTDQEVWSDWMTLPENYDDTQNWMWSMYSTNGLWCQFGGPVTRFWRASGSTRVCQTTGSAFSSFTVRNLVVRKMEVR